jgi:DNA polymerase-3 subunit epsilon
MKPTFLPTSSLFAIVDIETTGGNASQGSITEIAILIFDGNNIIDQFHTLVNPMQPIPLFIEKLTGISDRMVSKAPKFAEIAKDVFDLLNDKIFVAHNVNFDFSFIAHQLNQHGFKLQSRKLCTVRLSHKIFENLPSYSLGNLCRSLNIPIENRHRAMGDASATTKLFSKLLENDKQNHLDNMLKKGSRDAYLPIHLSSDDLDKMPNKPGIYFFHDSKDKIIYVGKAKRLRTRVISHFSNNDVSKRKQELMRLVHKISYREAGNELMMSVMESIEIKTKWPAFNRSQKRFEHKFGICSFIDQKGIMRLAVVNKKKNTQTHSNFPLQINGIHLLHSLSKEFKLCPKMCFLQNENAPCSGHDEYYCEGICIDSENIPQYNKKVLQAIEKLNSESPELAVFGNGRKENELSCIYIGKNDFLATGFIQSNAKKIKKEKLLTLLEPAPCNEYIKSLILNHASQFPDQSIQF